MIGVGATSLGFGAAPLRRVFQEIRSCGGDCVELSGQPGLHDGLVLDARSAPEVRGWAADAGVEIRSLGGYNDFAQVDASALEAEVERLRRTCELAAALEVGIVRAFAGDPKDGLTFAGVRSSVVEAFRAVGAAAAELGVTLAIENHGLLVNDGRELAALVDEIATPAVGLTLDTGNFCWAGHNLGQAADDVGAAIPHAVSVHVKDGVWRDGNFEFVPAGRGELDLVGVVDALRSRGFAGPVYSEYEGSGDFAAGTRESIDFLRAAFDGAG